MCLGIPTYFYQSFIRKLKGLEAFHKYFHDRQSAAQKQFNSFLIKKIVQCLKNIRFWTFLGAVTLLNFFYVIIFRAFLFFKCKFCLRISVLHKMYFSFRRPKMTILLSFYCPKTIIWKLGFKIRLKTKNKEKNAVIID